MIHVVRVPIQDAERIKEELKSSNQIHRSYRGHKDGAEFLIPIIAPIEGLVNEEHDDHMFKPGLRMPSAKELLEKQFTQDELELLKLSFDTVGEIAIIEVDQILESKQEIIGNAILQATPNITTVVKKVGHHQGTFRVQAVEVIAGKDTTVAEYRENGVRMLLDVGEVYFSPRLSTERKRIAQLVEPNEEILVMFSGCAPYVCVLAKMTEAKYITGVEINSEGHKFGLQNIALNKIKHAELHCGDVREIVPTLQKKYDRIVMPLPKTAEEFLDVAFPVSNPGAMIHLYAFMREEDLEAYYTKIGKMAKSAGVQYKVVKTVKCGQQSPHTYRFCIDIKVLE